MEDSYNSLEVYYTAPETQPLTQSVFENSSFEDSSSLNDDSMWGWLLPSSNFSFESLTLVNPCYSFGKLADCHVKIDEFNLRGKLKLSVISKKQFEIFVEGSGSTEVVMIKDFSMNGTFVNGNKIGKHKQVQLKNGDSIALTSPQFKVYTFLEPPWKIESLYVDWMPACMKRLYSLRSRLGHGAFGEVNLAQKLDGTLVAIKKLKKQGNDAKQFNEVKILQALQHPCIVRMEEVFETNNSIFIVLEYVNGGELSALLENNNRLSTFETKSLMYQLTLALQYLHNKGIAHRDLKPANILLCDNGNKCEQVVKLSDFGLSKWACSQTELGTVCGTLQYTAPEILLSYASGQPYTHQVDIWSLGVILFRCLCGKLPFHADQRKTLGEQIVSGRYSVTGVEWRDVSVCAVSLVRHMLQINPLTRINIDGILNHPWLQDEGVIAKVDRLLTNTFPWRDEGRCGPLVLPKERGIKRTRAEADLSH